MDSHQYHQHRLEEATQLLQNTSNDSEYSPYIPELLARLDAIAALGNIPNIESTKYHAQQKVVKTMQCTSLDAMPVVWTFAWSIRHNDTRLLEKLISLQPLGIEGFQDELQHDGPGSDGIGSQTAQPCTPSLAREGVSESSQHSTSQLYRPQLHAYETSRECLEQGPSSQLAEHPKADTSPDGPYENGTDHEMSNDEVNPNNSNRLNTSALIADYQQTICALQELQSAKNGHKREYTKSQARNHKAKTVLRTGGDEEWLEEKYVMLEEGYQAGSDMTHISGLLRSERRDEKTIVEQVR